MRLFSVIVALVMLVLSGCDKDGDKEKQKPKVEQPKVKPAPAAKKDEAKAGGDAFKPGVWVDLFDGKTLNGWKNSGFDKHGKPVVDQKLLRIPMGEPLCGVTSTRKDLPRMGYEIELEVEKVDGDDFFCALTFPVGKTHATLVLGGWGGSVCGISSIDFMDAANNSTTSVIEFKENEWYHVKVRVLPDRLQAWLDSEELVNVVTKDRNVDIRIDIEDSCPLGLATFQTVANYKYLRVRKLPKDFKLPEAERTTDGL